MDNVSNLDLMIANNFVFKIVSFEVIKWVIWPSLKHSILNFERIHSHAPVFRTLDGLDWKSHEYQYCSTHQDCNTQKFYLFKIDELNLNEIILWAFSI